MADPRFFDVTGPFTLAEIADAVGAHLTDGADPALTLRDVAPLGQAEPEHLSFLDNRKYVDAFTACRAGACIAPADLAHRAPPDVAILTSEAPYKSYALAAAMFHPVPPPVPGVHPAAVIDPAAVVGDGCRVEAGAVIEAGARIGARCLIGAIETIGHAVEIGDDTRIAANASLSHCLVGSRVSIFPGVRIGLEGFGFAADKNGAVRVPQLGRVIVEDDVEIGANCTVDRGAGPDTVIGQGCCIDNLVQIAHNVRIGRGTMIAAQTGIAGSARIGDFVQIGGQVGILGHLTVGDGVRLVGKRGVIRDIEPGATCAGMPAVPIRQWHRQSAQLARLAKGGAARK